MSARWERMYRLFVEPERVWQDNWDAKTLRHLNENVWIHQNLIMRMLSGDTERDFEEWEAEL